MARPDILAPDFTTDPWWWTAAPRPPATDPSPVPETADVAIVGSGYTGLAAALTLARAGRDVVVFEANEAGHGGSTRNAGFVGKTLKHSFSSLFHKHGKDYALAVYSEMQQAYDRVGELVRTEQIQCHYEERGRFIAANTPQHYDGLAHELELKHQHLGDEFEMVPRSATSRALGTEKYHGGAVIPALASIHPGLYQLGLLDRTISAGASVYDHTPVEGVQRDGSSFEVSTPRGKTRARNVFIATNGYTGPATRWQHRRVIPFRGFMIATEELEESVLNRLIPKSRVVHDYNNNLTFLRRAPDAPRLLLGGLTGTMSDDLETMGGRLRQRLIDIFPDIGDVRISRSWNGYCSGTFDLYPHIGVQDGAHYALGYCFAGLPMGTYLGEKAAHAILREQKPDTIFAEREPPKKWWYGGTPWFLPMYMAHLDRLDRKGN